jgi:hypothetical protein
MRCRTFFVLLLLLALATRASGEDKVSSAETGSFVTLKHGNGGEFRAFFAGPADADRVLERKFKADCMAPAFRASLFL